MTAPRTTLVPSSPAEPVVKTPTSKRLGPLDVLILSAWCGLAGGLLEVGTRIVLKVMPGHRVYGMSRHFFWMAPLSNLLLLTLLGLFLALGTMLWPRRGGWLAARFIGFVAVLPVVAVAGPRLYPWATALLALGISTRLIPILERRPAPGGAGISPASP